MNPYEYSTTEIQEMVSRYAEMKHFGASTYREAMYQYADMARGGEGGELGYTPGDWVKMCVDAMRPVDTPATCRAYNYPDYPDSFFRAVLDGLGEDW